MESLYLFAICFIEQELARLNCLKILISYLSFFNSIPCDDKSYHIAFLIFCTAAIIPYNFLSGIDEKALRATPIGKLLFGILDKVFPVFKEPNWFDVYDPPLSSEQNLELPYFDGFDFVNSSWTVYIRHRYGVWNWLDRIGVVPPVTTRVFIRGDGITMWSDGFYGDWYINPAINYIQIEKHFGRGYGYTQYSRGIRIFQVQKWNFEHEVGRYWNRGLRSYLRNETNYWALEGTLQNFLFF